jgi:predicted ATPase
LSRQPLSDVEIANSLPGYVFFDRGLIDPAAALEHLTNSPVLSHYAAMRFNRYAFLIPPWPGIYVRDEDGRQGLEDACAEYGHLIGVYSSLGYEVVILPKDTVAERTGRILALLSYP